MKSLKQRLKDGENLLGTMVTMVDNSELAKLLKTCGFDYFIIDCEHTGFNFKSVGAMLSMAKAIGIGGFVRLPEIQREPVLKYMEAGCAGLLLPNCNTPEQARSLVEHSKYAPLGNRGVSLFRQHTEYVKIEDSAAYMKKANEETFLMVQIESETAVSNIDEIMSVEGIDTALIGPNDLTQSMGIIGQFGDKKYLDALDRVIAAAKKAGKHSGIHLMDAKQLIKLKNQGMSMNLWSSDTKMILEAAKSGISEIKGG